MAGLSTLLTLKRSAKSNPTQAPFRKHPLNRAGWNSMPVSSIALIGKTVAKIYLGQIHRNNHYESLYSKKNSAWRCRNCHYNHFERLLKNRDSQASGQIFSNLRKLRGHTARSK